MIIWKVVYFFFLLNLSFGALNDTNIFEYKDSAYNTALINDATIDYTAEDKPQTGALDSLFVFAKYATAFFGVFIKSLWWGMIGLPLAMMQFGIIPAYIAVIFTPIGFMLLSAAFQLFFNKSFKSVT